MGSLYTTGATRRASEQPREELRREQCQAAAENDPGDLSFGAALPEHEHQAADDDGDEREGTREWSGEGRGEVVRGAFPRRLRERGNGREQECREGQRACAAPTNRVEADAGHR